jgi:hypothetical protein
VVYPLLRHFGMRAVAYIVPTWLGLPGMLTGPQLEEMEASGLVDVQAHSMTHRAIYVDSRVEDFFPAGIYAASRYLYPLRLPTIDLPAAFEGMPLYPATSRLSDCRRWSPAGAAERVCYQVLQRQRTAHLGKGWKSALRRELHRAGLDADVPGTLESADEQRAAIWAEVVDSKRALEERLPGKTIRHFAYPWHVGGHLSAQAVGEAGFVSCAGGLRPHQGVIEQGSLLPISRVNLDFADCLPGPDRKSFAAVITAKVVRRVAALGKPFENREA